MAADFQHRTYDSLQCALAIEPAEFFNVFKVVIQFGSILAVLVLYFHKLNPWSPKD